jgi:hypothetical protein
MRSLGAFVGHIAHAVRSDPRRVATTARTREIRREVEEEARPDGLVLRRTTIEEIEVPAPHREA